MKMRIITLHCDYIRFKPTKKAIPKAEELKSKELNSSILTKQDLFRQKEDAEAILVRFYSRRQIQTHLKNKDFPGSGDLVYRTGAVIK